MFSKFAYFETDVWSEIRFVFIVKGVNTSTVVDSFVPIDIIDQNMSSIIKITKSETLEYNSCLQFCKFAKSVDFCVF